MSSMHGAVECHARRRILRGVRAASALLVVIALLSGHTGTAAASLDAGRHVLAAGAPSGGMPGTGATCAPSSLGYACSLRLSKGAMTTLHWSPSGTMPVNHCTGEAPNAAATDMLHMAMEATTAGYVGLGFASSNRMYNSDVVLGYVSGSGAMVDTWNIASDYNYIQMGNAAKPAWTAFKAVSQRADSGATMTTICFSRALSAPSASVSRSLSATIPLQMIFAVSSKTSLTEHDFEGSLEVDLVTGMAYETSKFTKLEKMNTHGALMTVAWVFLFPLGTLVARHRWLFGQTMVKGVHLWFYLHGGLQLTGMVLFIIGFAYAWKFLPGGGAAPTGGDVGRAHQVLGTIIMGLAGLQVLAAFVRPSPDSKNRTYWNALHHNLGRLTLLCAWVTIYLGVYIAHGSSAYKSSYAAWLVPIAVVMGAMVVADIILSIKREGVAAAQVDEVPVLHKDAFAADDKQHMKVEVVQVPVTSKAAA